MTWRRTLASSDAGTATCWMCPRRFLPAGCVQGGARAYGQLQWARPQHSTTWKRTVASYDLVLDADFQRRRHGYLLDVSVAASTLAVFYLLDVTGAAHVHAAR